MCLLVFYLSNTAFLCLKVRAQEKEISEMQEHNTSLEEKISDMSMNTSSLALHDTSVNSLFNELEMTQLCHSMSTDSLNEAGQTNAVQLVSKVLFLPTASV